MILTEEQRREVRMVTEATNEKTSIEILNLPTLIKNRKIREHNARIVRRCFAKSRKEVARLRVLIKDEIPNPHRMSDECRGILARETRNRLALVNRQPLHWVQVIEQLPQYIRHDVARLIWWDFFAGRESSVRWEHLDRYINVREQVAADEAIIVALIACGYSVYAAWRRVMACEGVGEEAAA